MKKIGTALLLFTILLVGFTSCEPNRLSKDGPSNAVSGIFNAVTSIDKHSTTLTQSFAGKKDSFSLTATVMESHNSDDMRFHGSINFTNLKIDEENGKASVSFNMSGEIDVYLDGFHYDHTPITLIGDMELIEKEDHWYMTDVNITSAVLGNFTVNVDLVSQSIIFKVKK